MNRACVRRVRPASGRRAVGAIAAAAALLVVAPSGAAALPPAASAGAGTGLAAVSVGALSPAQLLHLRRVLGDVADPRFAEHPIATAFDPNPALAAKARRYLLSRAVVSGSTESGGGSAGVAGPIPVADPFAPMDLESVTVTAPGGGVVDARSGHAVATVRIRVASNAPVQSGVLDLMAVDPRFGALGRLLPAAGAVFAEFGPADRVAGTAMNGTYAVRVPLPRFAGRSLVRWRVGDLAVNSDFDFLYRDAYHLQGFHDEITVRQLVDRTPPAISDVHLGARSVRADSASNAVSFAYNVDDAQSGVADGALVYGSPSDNQFAATLQGAPPAKRGTAIEHMTGDMLFNAHAETGAWTPDFAYVADQAGNEAVYERSGLAGLPALQVDDAAPDTTAPTLLALSPTSLTVPPPGLFTGGPTLRWTASDALSGVAFVACDAVGPLDAADQGFIFFDDGSTVPRPGTSTGTTPLLLQADTVPGRYHVRACLVEDGAGNDALPGVIGPLPNQVVATVSGPAALLFHPTRGNVPAVLVRGGRDTAVGIGGRYGVPAEARAIVVAATVRAATARGRLGAGAADSPKRTALAAAAPGLVEVGTGTVPLSSTGALALQLTKGSATASLRIEGYYAAGRPGYAYHFAPRAPIVTRPATVVGPGADRLVDVVRAAGAHAADVRAVAVTVSVTSPTADALVSVGNTFGSIVRTVRVRRGIGASGTAYLRPDASGRVLVRISAGQATVRVRVLGWYAAAAVRGGLYLHLTPDRSFYTATEPPLGPLTRYVSADAFWDFDGVTSGVAPQAAGVLLSAAVRAPDGNGILCVERLGPVPACVGTLVRTGHATVTSLAVPTAEAGLLRTSLLHAHADVRFVAVGYFAAA
jgi:hypothetical protein